MAIESKNTEDKLTFGVVQIKNDRQVKIRREEREELLHITSHSQRYYNQLQQLR